MLETNDEWTVARRYMGLQSLARIHRSRITDNANLGCPPWPPNRDRASPKAGPHAPPYGALPRPTLICRVRCWDLPRSGSWSRTSAARRVPRWARRARIAWRSATATALGSGRRGPERSNCAFAWKQWRDGANRFRQMSRRGVPRWLAAQTLGQRARPAPRPVERTKQRVS
jgi:hypothetical protein